jgi:hypothetical protein
MSVCLAGVSVTYGRALDICEPSYVPGAVRHFFIHMVHNPAGGRGYVVTPELSSQGGDAEAT